MNTFLRQLQEIQNRKAKRQLENLNETIQSEDEKQSEHVMLVSIVNNEHVWQEFSLPLNVFSVENWACKSNVKFLEVNINLRQKDFELREWRASDIGKIPITDPNSLVNGKCYLVVGTPKVAKTTIDEYYFDDSSEDDEDEKGTMVPLFDDADDLDDFFKS